mmetsp:Transcript_95532/g.265417  ORF Transcript_95532/g.265417 Transcript_95532/m.265417 type:complete len:176 (+) Transcript_95532:62-589(+)
MARRSSLLVAFVLALVGVCLLQLALQPQEDFLSGTASRREALGAAAAAAALAGAAAAPPALADWQGEPVGMLRLYGPEILKLKDAVESSDFDTMAQKLIKFDLFAQGVYKNQAAKQGQASAVVDKLADAIEAKNAGELKAQYAEFLKVTSLPELFKGPPGNRYHLVTRDSSMATR